MKEFNKEKFENKVFEYIKKYKRWVQICQKILYLITNKKLYEKSLHANVIISWSLD